LAGGWARETDECLRSEYVILFRDQGTKDGTLIIPLHAEWERDISFHRIAVVDGVRNDRSATNMLNQEKEDRAMYNLIPLIFIAVFVYLIFFRRGGVGCCGGHGAHESARYQDVHSGKSSHDSMENVIDLREDEYTILPSEDDKLH
jgi:hypothetical protein